MALHRVLVAKEHSVSQLALSYTTCNDANNLKNGVYCVNKSKNAPFDYGVLIQFGSTSFDRGYIAQLAIEILTNKVFARCHLEGAWKEWREL